jgi:hypothetical protein
MKKQIVNVSMFQTAKVAAALYFVISIPFLAIMAVGMMFSNAPGMGIGMLVVFPLLYALFGFIFTLIGAWVYNLVASKIGGIEFTTKEVG